MTLGDPSNVVPLLDSPAIERNAELSRDGRWLAFESDESGRLQIIVRPFPDVERGWWQVSTDGGTQPVWSRDGRELFFIDGRKWLVSVTVTTAPQFAVSEAKPILDMNPYFTNDSSGRPYDVSLDGQRFLVLKDASDPANRPQAIAVLNWLDELKRLVP